MRKIFALLGAGINALISLSINITLIVLTFYVIFNYFWYFIGMILLILLVFFGSIIQVIRKEPQFDYSMSQEKLLIHTKTMFRWNPLAQILFLKIINQMNKSKKENSYQTKCKEYIGIVFTKVNINKKYRELAKLYHPDTTILDEEVASYKFIEISECRDELLKKIKDTNV